MILLLVIVIIYLTVCCISLIKIDDRKQSSMDKTFAEYVRKHEQQD